MKKKESILSLFNIILFVAVLIFANVLASHFYTQIDLTEDKRYSLTRATKNLLFNLEDEIYVKVLLEGQFPAGFKRLKESAADLLSEFNTYSGNLEVEFQDPSPQGASVQQLNDTRDQLRKDGINPQNLRIMDGDEMTNKLIYPFAIFSKGQKSVAVNMLEPQTPGVSDEVTLNNSISLLEYKFADAIQKLSLSKRANILLTEGNGEIQNPAIAALMMNLREFYNVGRINLDSTYKIHDDVDILILPKPTIEISQRSQFLIDQYLMRGGNIIWLIDRLNANLDSINVNKFYIALNYELGIDDMLFKYGVRFQDNFVLDMECSGIPQVIGESGGKAQPQMFPWPYHIMAASQNNHPINRNIDRVNLKFPSSIDIIETKDQNTTTVLLKSSPYTMYQRNPVRLNFEILKYGLQPEKFNKEPQNLAVLIEGEFESAFKNRVPSSFLNALEEIGEKYVEESGQAKQLFVSDGDFIKNQFNATTGKFSPLGFSRWEGREMKGNEDFIMNAIEYMLDQHGVLLARSKEVKLRLLDTVKAKSEKTKWRLINIVGPLFILLVFGILFNFFRRSRFTT